jgi:hypothetical protein
MELVLALTYAGEHERLDKTERDYAWSQLIRVLTDAELDRYSVVDIMPNAPDGLASWDSAEFFRQTNIRAPFSRNASAMLRNKERQKEP